jgi:enoyl-CoA hydratase/carnithine racemase
LKAVRAFERYTAATDTEEVARLVDRCFDSEDYREGRHAFLEKRTSVFKDQ